VAYDGADQIKVDDRLRLADHVYAVGDPVGHELSTHLGHYEGEMAVRIALGDDVTVDFSATPRVVYTDPEAAAVGLRLDQAQGKGYDAFEETTGFPKSTKGYVVEADMGYLGIVVDRKRKVLLGAFIARQRTARHPLMPLRIFASRNVTGANLVQVLGTAGMFGMFFLGSLYLRQIQGYDPLQIGLAFLPVAVVMGTLSVRYTDRLVMRFGARRLLFPGLGLIAAGLALFALAPAARGGYLIHVLPVTLLIGAGAGLCFPALMTLAMSSATPQDAGLASGLASTTAQIGGALGLAVLATVSASRTNALIAQHRPTAAALTEGYRLAFWIAFGLVVAAVAVAATLLRPQRAIAAEPQRAPELVPAVQAD